MTTIKKPKKAGSKIEWTGHTWNPIVGCSVYSPGCKHCYAMIMAHRIQAMADTNITSDTAQAHYVGTTRVVNGHPVWTGKIAVSPSHTLHLPLSRMKPTTYFVCSMSDLFHEATPEYVIDHVFAVMALTPQHTYQVLTKRSDRMRAYLSDPKTPRRVYELAGDLAVDRAVRVVLIAPGIDESLAPLGTRVYLDTWPLANVWAGVSAEDQKRADERIPDLLASPAAIRFVSAEPLLGPIDFTAIPRTAAEGHMRPLDGRFNRIDWIIVGGESGNSDDIRPTWVPHVRAIAEQCKAAGVAVFVKQLGSVCHDDIAAIETPVEAVGNVVWSSDVDFEETDDPGKIRIRLRDKKGGNLAEWPADLRLRQMPAPTP